jgi:hypothetical protein
VCELIGGSTGTMLQLANDTATACIVKSVVHPVYMVMNSASSAISFDNVLSEESTIAVDGCHTAVTLPVDNDSSLTGVAGGVKGVPLTVAADVNEASILTCEQSDVVDMHITETDQLSTHDVVMHLDDIGAANIVLQYSDIVEEAGEMVLTSLNDHCYEISDISNHNIATVLYDEGSAE